MVDKLTEFQRKVDNATGPKHPVHASDLAREEAVKRVGAATLAKYIKAPVPEGTPCEECGATDGVERQSCRTAYADDSMNTSPALCPPCAKEYNDHWDDMWAEYYNGLL